MTQTLRATLRTLQVRLRFIMILVGALAVAGQWESLQNHWEKLTSRFIQDDDRSRIGQPDTEYFCPMDPVVVAKSPGKCDICNMALVRRKVGDTSPLPSGVLARMQITPYRMQLAGVQTAPVEYQPTAREVNLTGTVTADKQVECPVPERYRSWMAPGQAAEVARTESDPQPTWKAKVTSPAAEPQAKVTLRLEDQQAAAGPAPGTRVLVTIRKPVAELEPFRSLPTNAPPLAKGELVAVYNCPQHPEVLAVGRGRCPVDRENELQRRGLLENQRLRWSCPAHTGVVSEKAEEPCPTCRGKLAPRVVTYQPPGKVLTVPESAVIDTGTRKVVFIEQMAGMFDSVEITTGPRCGDVYPVAGGLQPGQRVVVNGAFLLDAETRLNPSLAANYFGAARSGSSPSGDKPGQAKAGLCPVTGKPLGSMGPPITVEVNGRKVELCCDGCEERLRKSPEKYLGVSKSK